MSVIKDGTGTKNAAKVNSDSRLQTQTVAETEGQHAAEIGNAYNINTGNITLSAAGTVLYLKNNEDLNLFICSIALGVGVGCTSNIGELTIIRNPTAGDLISDATVVCINQNRNFGSNEILTADVFKGKSGGTITGGNDIAVFYQGTNGRIFASINMLVPKGSSIAMKYDPKLSSGSVKLYGAFICFLKDLDET